MVSDARSLVDSVTNVHTLTRSFFADDATDIVEGGEDDDANIDNGDTDGDELLNNSNAAVVRRLGLSPSNIIIQGRRR